MIKTITTEEKLIFLNNVLPAYIERLISNETALARIWGVFQVQCVGNYSTSLILMDNVSVAVNVGRRFDLKGSLHARKAKGKVKVGKDCNFLEDVGQLSLEPEDSRILWKRLSDDVAMLSSFNIMDYSLLVTEVSAKEARSCNPLYIYKQVTDSAFYTIALIDYFQEYNFKKKAERFWKTKVQRVNPDDLSATNSKRYAERFMKFVETILDQSTIKTLKL